MGLSFQFKYRLMLECISGIQYFFGGKFELMSIYDKKNVYSFDETFREKNKRSFLPWMVIGAQTTNN